MRVESPAANDERYSSLGIVPRCCVKMYRKQERVRNPDLLSRRSVLEYGVVLRQVKVDEPLLWSIEHDPGDLGCNDISYGLSRQYNVHGTLCTLSPQSIVSQMSAC